MRNEPEKAWEVLMLFLWQSAHSPNPTTSTVVKSLPWQKVAAKRKRTQRNKQEWFCMEKEREKTVQNSESKWMIL